VAGLTELLVEGDTSAAMRLLGPVLARFTTGEQRWSMLIAPPWMPYAPGLSSQGLGLPRILVIQARRAPEALWAFEEALASGACAAVVAWIGRGGRALLQRLHFLAGKGETFAVLVRTTAFRPERSPALLRLALKPTPQGGLHIEMCRNRLHGGGPWTLQVAAKGLGPIQ
jgi:protein ImuA